MEVLNETSTIPEIGLTKKQTDFPRVKISCSEDSNAYARQFYFDDISIYESMFLILLDRIKNTIGYVKLSQGGCSGTYFDVQLIAKYAVSSLCDGLILVHNHPSGNNNPSESDKRLTAKVKATLNIFDCDLFDHIIITEDETKYYSFADEGKL